MQDCDSAALDLTETLAMKRWQRDAAETDERP